VCESLDRNGAEAPAPVARVLVVEDDANVADVVITYLRAAGMTVDHIQDGVAAVDTHTTSTPRIDLVLLDRMLPGLDGLEVCRRVRASHPELPVVMLTALGDEDDRIAGLEVGADDYLVKPFSPRELVLRVQAVLRRTAVSMAPSRPAEPTHVVDGDLEVDSRSRQALLAGNPLTLTTREFDLLSFLISHPGTAFSRDELMKQVWGWDFGDQSTVTVHVRRLREKVEHDPSDPTRIVTVYGVGYRWDPVP
jgi:DNA-binding response OmpR family regulator